jgi:gas vesicle protein
LAGVTAGALLGILLAPEKGKETRRRFLDKNGEFTEGLKDKFSEFVGGIKQKGDDFQQEADTQFAKGKKKFEEAKKDVEYTTM